MEILIAICSGIGLAAACGLRVFLPLLALSAGAKLGLVTPSEGWEWIASTPALVALSCATFVEVAGYSVPWIDHALDTLATPLAVTAGAVAALSTMGVVSGIDPMVSHAGALLTGGAAAGAVQGASVLTRAASTTLTAGVANPVISWIQNAVSAAFSLIAIVAPVVAGLALLLIAAILVRRWTRRPSAARTPAPLAA